MGKDEGQEEIEATGDAIVIADSIRYAGEQIAGSIRELARALEFNGEPEEEPEFYLDGSKK